MGEKSSRSSYHCKIKVQCVILSGARLGRHERRCLLWCKRSEGSAFVLSSCLPILLIICLNVLRTIMRKFIFGFLLLSLITVSLLCPAQTTPAKHPMTFEDMMKMKRLGETRNAGSGLPPFLPRTRLLRSPTLSRSGERRSATFPSSARVQALGWLPRWT